MASVSFMFLCLIYHLHSLASSTNEFYTGDNSSDSFIIPFHSLESSKNDTLKRQQSRDSAFNTKAISLDERCRKGHPLSLAWYQYPPYTVTDEARPQSTEELGGVIIRGMLPAILNKVLQSCCNESSHVSFGKFLKSSWEINDVLRQGKVDFSFPVQRFDTHGGASKTFRNRPFIALVQAPRVVLLVNDVRYGKNQGDYVVLWTVIRAWPMLAFLILMASIASEIVWFWDRNCNPEEFPPSFLLGVWEGFWWALVTMATVGYGDRKPKSFFARLFAIAWILGGISLLSIFTAIVTSALSASIQLNFRKHGAVLGAMNGSEEYRLGVNLNADVKVFNHVETMIMSLAKGDIDGALVDNYVITHHLDIMQKEPIRIEEHISHAVTYGVVLGHGSSEFEFCARRYIRHHPQDVFEAFARHLTPLKNPTDDVSSQSKAAERLIFQPKSLSVLVYGGLGIVLILSAIGIVWDFACRRQKITVHNSWKKATKKLHVLSKQSQERIGKRLALIEKPTRPWNADELDELITKYQAFHRKWLDKLTAMKDAGVITVNTV